MSVTNSSVIHLTVERSDKAILIQDILYAQVTDKLCTIYLAKGKPLEIFITLTSLRSMLPAADFFQISRNCLVAFKHITNIYDTYVVMSDSSRLPFSRRKRSDLLYAFRKYLSERPLSEIAAAKVPAFLSGFRNFDACPFAFFIVEVISDNPRLPGNFIFRYANESMAQLEKLPLSMILNFPLPTVLGENRLDYLQPLANVALYGGSANFYKTSSLSGKLLHLLCYQPHRGYCACIAASASGFTPPPKLNPDDPVTRS